MFLGLPDQIGQIVLLHRNLKLARSKAGSAEALRESPFRNRRRGKMGKHGIVSYHRAVCMSSRTYECLQAVAERVALAASDCKVQMLNNRLAIL